ncbi:MAG: 4Fe-4S binding protein, partial [Spirochaetaceae bacterium]
MKGRFSKIRFTVQILFFLFVAGLAVWGQIAPAVHEQETGQSGSGDLHSICPFGAVETAGRLLTQGLFVPKTSPQNMVVFGALAFLTILFGAVFCGWLCPLGSIQEWVGKLGKKIFGRKYNHFVLPKIDRIFGYLRYGVLALVIFKTTELVTLTFTALDPFYALFNFFTGSALPSALVVLGVVLAASLFVERPWCRWFCPLGALTGLIQKLSPWKIRTRAGCTECGRCTYSCPVNIDVCAKPAVTDAHCIRCMECLDTCNKDALGFSLPGGK